MPAVIENEVMTKLAVQNLGRAIVSQKQNLPEKDTSLNGRTLKYRISGIIVLHFKKKHV